MEKRNHAAADAEAEAAESIDLFEYLILRIKEVGVQSIHGVPGDFNLTALDYISKCGLRWIGNCNELNAGYAADGYARVNGISALMTIMGVGELSALNALAGSYAEYIPVIHIVCMPSRRAQADRLCLHHTFGDGDFGVFQKLSAAVSCMTAVLDCPHRAAGLIDEAVRTCWVRRRPVCLFVPADMIRGSVFSGGRLERGLDLRGPGNDAEVQRRVVETIMGELRRARSPVVLVGGYAVRHHLQDEVLGLVKALAVPVLVSASGRGIVDESHPLYSGLYVGNCSEPQVLGLMQSTDLVVSIGNIQSDLGTAGFSGQVSSNDMVDLQMNRICVRGELYPNINVKPLLQTLIARVESSYLSPRCSWDTEVSVVSSSRHPKTSQHCWFKRLLKPEPIQHDWLWPMMGSWLRDDDVILAEAGTASFGIWKTQFRAGTIFIAQYLWASIGFTVGACQGASLAVQDSVNSHRRTILFVGDGSLQVACQELSTILRYGLAPIIFVICNNGYTIERLIHGPENEYNDIQPWKYRRLPAVFGAQSAQYRSHQVHTKRQLQRLLNRKSFSDCSRLQV
ncbi:Pyruvate decarboxylase 1 [Aspergillus nanangensis]|uniref:Pyruvate decarboxylase n=1 Tax=Aspergillus nanangensis TaxID=2582783 RepID=A0AAD4CFC6_ASPNN|nr:Pyruvate decarboxylase 1 [Aspergillus nanangensis]